MIIFPLHIMKIHSHYLHASLCGILVPHSVNAAHFVSLIGAQPSTNWDAHLAGMNFQTRSSGLIDNPRLQIVKFF